MLDYPDLINGAFEVLGALAIFGHVRRVMKDKAVAGVSIASVAFFASWGFWNLYYYPHLGQWASFAGGIAIVLGTCLWIAGLVYYTRHPKEVYIDFKSKDGDPALVVALKEYIELLSDEVENLTLFAHNRSTRVEAGRACRTKIARLEK